MNKRETDISLIRKYLDGELDARAMHQLERRAQDDPFLMDALEGYEHAGNNQHQQLDELAGRLRRRVEPTQKRIIPLNFLAIAASVLIIFTIGGLWLTHREGAVENKVATNKAKEKTNALPPRKEYAAVDKPGEKLASRPAEAAVPIKKSQKNVLTTTSANSAPIGAADMAVTVDKNPAQKDTTPLNEMVVMGYTGKAKKDTTKSPANTEMAAVKKNTSPAAQQLLQSQAAGVAANNVNAPKPRPGMVLPGRLSTLALKEIAITKKDATPRDIISGRVVGGDDGLPIPGASVKMAGTNFNAVTDANGRFSLRADSGDKAKLVVGYLGYKTREVNARGRDSLKTISLEPANSSLNEVVVTESAQRGAREQADISAHPTNGWHSFKKYLKKNALSPDGKKGVVKLSFNVGRDGVITDIKINKGLSASTDKAAADLVKNGPAWVGNSNGMPEKVTLRIKFDR